MGITYVENSSSGYFLMAGRADSRIPRNTYVVFEFSSPFHRLSKLIL